MKIHVIGNPEMVQGFALSGLEGTVAQNAAAVRQALDDALQQPGLGLILLSEDAARLVPKRMRSLATRSDAPVVLTLPGPGEPSGRTVSIQDLVNDAIGVRHMKAGAE